MLCDDAYTIHYMCILVVMEVCCVLNIFDYLIYMVLFICKIMYSTFVKYLTNTRPKEKKTHKHTIKSEGMTSIQLLGSKFRAKYDLVSRVRLIYETQALTRNKKLN